MPFMAPITNFVREHVYVVKENVDQSAAKFVHISIPQHDSSPLPKYWKIIVLTGY